MAVLSFPFKFSGLSMQQQKDEAKVPHLWLVTGAIKNMAVLCFLCSFFFCLLLLISAIDNFRVWA